MLRRIALACVIVAGPGVANLHAQDSCIRIMEQDSTINNLVDPPGYVTTQPGTLGGVVRVGNGPQTMILIPGFGFGGSIFDEFMEKHKDSYSMYAVTLAGFGGTAAPPSPDERVSFGEQTWTNGAVRAIEKLIDDEKIHQPVIIGHWIGGTQVALRLAMNRPENIRAVVLLAGSAKMVLTDTTYAAYYETPEKRAASIDRFLAPRWFKTVTRETWDDNNFLPGDYAVNPVRALRLWREAASPPLHVWVRYLCEFNAQDISFTMKDLRVPTLLLKPDLGGLWYQPGQNYMEGYCHQSWAGAVESNEHIHVETVPHSRVCLWFDNPEEAGRLITDFLKN